MEEHDLSVREKLIENGWRESLTLQPGAKRMIDSGKRDGQTTAKEQMSKGKAQRICIHVSSVFVYLGR